MKDVENIEGKLHVWLPDSDDYKDHAVIGADAVTFIKYTGSIPFTSSEGILVAADNIILRPEFGFPGVEGSAVGVRGEPSLQYMQPPKKIYPGYKLVKYTADAGGGPRRIDVAKPDGTLFKNASGYTDDQGVWTHEYDSKNIILRGDLAPIEYQVKFDANVPRNASTKDRLSGTMKNQEFTYDNEQYLSQNTYDLPGYKFKEWNTKADGTGTSYADKAEAKNLTDKEGDIVILYAQWTPETYMIMYRPGNPPGGGDYAQIAYFDQSDTLMPVEKTAWTYPNHVFHGWTDSGLGSFYKDGSSFYNLCGPPDEDGNLLSMVKLTAEWVETEKIKVSVTRDGVPQEDLAQYLFLIGKTGDVDGQVFRGMFEQIGPTGTDPGVTYLYDPVKQGKSIPEGTYDLCFDPAADEGTNTTAGPSEYFPSSVEIDYGGAYAVSTVFDYYTVSISKDPAQEDQISSVAITDAGGVIQPSADNKIFAPGGHKLNIQTAMKEGYHFDGYSVMGVAPGSADNGKDFDPQVQNQTITVRGTADIMAHAEANTYTVKFNGIGSNVEGTMTDQDMVYGEPQELFANQFTRPGGSFAVWTTKEDGSGAKYNDKATVDKMTTENGGVVNLYTQWDMTTFNIEYDLDEGRLPAGKTNPDKYRADTETFTLNNPEKKDYDFVGWMGTGLSNPTKEVTIEEGSLGDRRYLAVWTIKTYHVDFEDNGGTPVERQIVEIHEKATRPQDPTRDGYTFGGWYTDSKLSRSYDFDQPVEEDITLYAKWDKIQPPTPEPAASETPSAKMKAGKKSMTIVWNKVQGAEGYDIFFAKCNHGKTKKKCKKIKTIEGNETFKWTKSGLKKGIAFKAYVRAFVYKNGKKTYISKSPTFHAFTGNGSKKYTNARSVTLKNVKEGKLSLKQGETFRIKAKVNKINKKKKLVSRKHAPTLRYTTSDSRIATVSKKGRITAIGKGTCTVIAFAHNGVSKEIEVTVK